MLQVAAFVHTNMLNVRLLCDDACLLPNAQLYCAVCFIIFGGASDYECSIVLSWINLIKKRKNT
jgi:hypothetical protein